MKPDLGSRELADSRSNQVSRDVERLKPTLSLTAEDLQEVQDLAFTVDDDFFLRRAWQVFVLAFDSDTSREAYLDLENGIIGFLDTCIAGGHMGLAADALAATKSVYESSDDHDVREALARILASRYTERNIGIIERIMTTGKEIEHFQCGGYLARLSADAIPVILKMLPVCTKQSARHTVVLSVASLAEKCPGEILRSVDTTSPEEVEAALDILDTIGTEAALEVALGFSKHASVRVRARVASLAGGLKTATASNVAGALVNDHDDSVRRRAVVSLVKIRGEGAVETLVRLFTSKEFGQLSHDSKLSMLVAVRNLSSKAQMQVIQAVLNALLQQSTDLTHGFRA